MDEQLPAAPQARFEIERWAPANPDAPGLELDRWEICDQTAGTWDHEVLAQYLAEHGRRGVYRVLRYADHYTDVSVFEVYPETIWHLDRRRDNTAPPVVALNGESVVALEDES
jgi:hypothetical protein